MEKINKIVKEVFYEVLGYHSFRNPHTFEFSDVDLTIEVTFKKKNWVKKSITFFVEVSLDDDGLPNGKFLVKDINGCEVILTNSSLSSLLNSDKDLKESLRSFFEGFFLLWVNNISY